MHDVRQHAAERGIDLPPPHIDLTRTRAWKNSLRRDQDGWVQVLTDAGYGIYPGEAAGAHLPPPIRLSASSRAALR